MSIEAIGATSSYSGSSVGSVSQVKEREYKEENLFAGGISSPVNESENLFASNGVEESAGTLASSGIEESAGTLASRGADDRMLEESAGQLANGGFSLVA